MSPTPAPDAMGELIGDGHQAVELIGQFDELVHVRENGGGFDLFLVHSFWCSFWLTAEVVVVVALIPASLPGLVAGIGIVGMPEGVPAVAAVVGVSPAITPGGVEPGAWVPRCRNKVRSLGVLGVLHCGNILIEFRYFVNPLGRFFSLFFQRRKKR